MSDESDEQDAIVQEFLIESYENLDSLDREFVDLERDPGNVEILSSIFRTIHTIKGTSGFLAFTTLETVTHRGENLLSQLRNGEKEINPDITNGLLAMVDAVRDILAIIEETGREGDEDYKSLIANLESLTAADASGLAPTEEATSESEETFLKADSDQDTEGDEAKMAPEPTAAPVTSSPEPPVIANEASDSVSAKPPEGGRPSQTRGPSVAESSIRVDVGLLDQLMNLVGELVLARNQVVQYSAAQSDNAFVATCQQLNLITTELQEGVMKTRMQPIENVWNKFPRIVRDLANGCDKQVTVEMEGKETELDKTIIESIKDPLTHIVRNSVDHGIESPADRIAAGKPAEGRLLLRAFHEGGLVNIEIADDGGGIDPTKLKAKALEKNVITADRAARMTDREVVNLVFEAGFSTAAKVTNVSGRGVGMDVVRSNVEKIGGSVDVQSKLGQGTTLRIKIPLTLAIIPALIVGNDGHRFAIPQVNLLELLRLEGDQAAGGIEMIHGAPVYRLRGKLLPIVYLREEFRSDRESVEKDVESDLPDATNIVVLQADDHQFGLVVDTVNDTEEIVVKPLGDQLKGLSAFAGATIMGDGNVALILDVMGLAQRANIISETAHHEEIAAETVRDVDSDAEPLRSLLILGMGGDRKMAIDLSLVARLEEFRSSSVERTGNRQAVQYRDRIMPLIQLPDRFGLRLEETSEGDRETIHVVVYKQGDQSIGLVVDEILDVVEERVRIEHCSDMDGVSGTAVVQGDVTDLIDVEGIVRSEPGLANEIAVQT